MSARKHLTEAFLAAHKVADSTSDARQRLREELSAAAASLELGDTALAELFKAGDVLRRIEADLARLADATSTALAHASLPGVAK